MSLFSVEFCSGVIPLARIEITPSDTKDEWDLDIAVENGVSIGLYKQTVNLDTKGSNPLGMLRDILNVLNVLAPAGLESDNDISTEDLAGGQCSTLPEIQERPS